VARSWSRLRAGARSVGFVFLLAHSFLGLLTSRRRARQPRSGLGWWPVGARRAGRLLIQRGAPVHSQVAVAGGARGCGSKFFPGAEEAVSSQRLLRDGCATLRSRRIAPTRLLVLFDPFLPQRPGPRVAVLTDAHATGTRGALASLSGRSVSSFRTPNVVGGAGVVRDVVTYGFVFPVRVTQSITFGRTLGYLQRGSACGRASPCCACALAWGPAASPSGLALAVLNSHLSSCVLKLTRSLSLVIAS
jgi:hypothetical protein